MAILETVAKAFHVPPQSLLQESLRTYLKQKLLKVESDLFILSKKYGVHDVLELDVKVKAGFFHELEAHDDYFRLDYLEAESDQIKHLSDTL
jgi:hypothetical protein